GHVEEEYAWFASADNMKVITVTPEKMARKIIDAMVHGDPTLISPMNAAMAARWHGVARGTSTELMALAARLLPRAGGRDRPVPGWAIEQPLPETLQKTQE